MGIWAHGWEGRQAGRPAAYTPPGWFIRSAGRILFGVGSLGGCGGWGLAGLNIIEAGVVTYAFK